MKRLLVFTLTCVWLAACDAPSAPATPETTTPPSFGTILNQRFPISGIATDNICPGAEPVAFEGWAHLLVTGEQTDRKVRLNVLVEGVGLISGDRYIGIQNNNAEFSTTEEEVDVRFRLIRQGSEDNFWLRLTFRVTFPPGEVEIIRDEIECRG